jgi:succinate--hydroxymethylglutarate CoA-transferase
MLPLAGIRIIAVEQYGAGPFGSMQLADLGAEVIKIENHTDGGDMARRVGPFFVEGESQFFQSLNRNKKSITLNLKAARGREVLHRLVATADATLDNLRGDLPVKLGLTYDALKEANPRIVCSHLSAYGREGSRAGWPGYDYLMQAEAGYLSLTGEPGGPPARCGLSIVDFMTGVYSAFALTSALLGARSTGKGRDIDVNLFDCALQNLSYLATWFLNEGHNQGREPRSAHPSITPSQLFKTADGYIFVMCNKEKFWPVLCELIGSPDLRDDPDFSSFEARLRNRERLTKIIDDQLAAKNTREWLDIFAGRVPAAPINDIEAVLQSSMLAEGDRIWTLEHPSRTDFRVLGAPFRLGDEALPREAAPALGQHTDEILSACGYGPGELALLRDEGVI